MNDSMTELHERSAGGQTVRSVSQTSLTVHTQVRLSYLDGFSHPLHLMVYTTVIRYAVSSRGETGGGPA